MARTSMEKLSSLDMDLMARMRVLEGATGAPLWSFSRDRRSIGEALKALPREYPDINPEWFAIKDWGLQDAVLMGARKVLKSETGSDTAEEIAQNLAAGLSPSGGKKEDVYGWIGAKHGRKILSGGTTPKGIKNQLYMAAERRAVDVFRKSQTSTRQREQHSPTLVDTGASPGQVGADVVLDRSPMEALLSLLSSPAGRQMKTWIYRTMQSKANPTQLAVFDAWLDDPGATNAELGKSAPVIAERGAPISGQMAGRHLKSVVDIAKSEMQKNPKVTDWIDRYMDLQQLGYGGGALRYASRDSVDVLLHPHCHHLAKFRILRGSQELIGHAELHGKELTIRCGFQVDKVASEKQPLLSREEHRAIRDGMQATKVAQRFLG